MILTCSTGEGHNSAAYAIKSYLKKQEVECIIEDPVSFQSERMKKIVSSLYNVVIQKVPFLFGIVYKLGSFYCTIKLPSPVYWANAQYANTLKTYIINNKFDAVICTHLYGMEAMTAIRKDENFRIPCYGVLTDYICIPFFEETNLDGYFVPHEDQKKYLQKKGIKEKNIIVSGIPVHNTFRDHMSKENARKSLHITNTAKVFLIMTGGVGCENMARLYDKLLQSIQPNDLIVVLAGKNEKLKKKLTEKYIDNPQIKVIGFTRQVALYMAAADVLLSKSGGLSSTEAAVANVPLVHVNVIPGCETYNARFFAKHGMSLYAHNDRQAIRYAKKLAYNTQAAEKMQKRQQDYIKADAVETIVRTVISQ